MKLKDAIIQACKNQGRTPLKALSRPYRPDYIPGSKRKPEPLTQAPPITIDEAIPGNPLSVGLSPRHTHFDGLYNAVMPARTAIRLRHDSL